MKETAEAPDYADRLDAIVADDGRGRSDRLRALLRVGAERFGVETGLLSRVDPAAGTHTITEVHGPPPAGSGTPADLSTTYARTVIAENAVLGVTNAPEQGWAEDPAYDRFGASTYLGAKVVMDGSLYGVVSFVDPAPRSDPFGEADAAALGLLVDAVERALGPASRPNPTRQQLEALFDGSPSMINLHDLEGNLIAPNTRLCEETGYTADELTRMKVWDLDQDATPERVRAGCTNMEPGDRRRWEGRFRRKDGSIFPVEAHIRRLDVSGAVRCAVVSRDITERKAAEATIVDRQEKIQTLYETTSRLPRARRPGVVAGHLHDLLQELFDYPVTAVNLRRGDVLVPKQVSVEGRDGIPNIQPLPIEGESIGARAYRTGETVVVEDLRTLDNDIDYGTLRGAAGIPIEGHGVIVVSWAEDGKFDSFLLRLVDILAAHAATVLDRVEREDTLREERDRFATLFQNLPTPVVHGRTDDEGQIQVRAVNEAFERVFGHAEEDIRGEDIRAFIVPEEERPRASAIRRRLLSGEPTVREVRRVAADGRRDFRIQVALQQSDTGPAEGYAIYTDITERKERERALAQRTALLEAQAEATIDGLLAVDDDRRVVFHNDRFLDLWGLPAPSDDGASPPLPEHRPLDALSDRVHRPEAFRSMVDALYAHPGKDGRNLIRRTGGRWLDQYSAPIVGRDDTHFGRLWTVRDVTERRRMQERLLEVQEEERRRIDQEIHDEMGGLLTSLQFTVGLARRQAGDDAVLDALDQAETLVSDLSTMARTISRKLYPSALSDYGLAGALPSLADTMAEERGLAVDLRLEIEAETRFSSLVERTAYWVIQEALVNVTRHAETDAAHVTVTTTENQIALAVADDGVGFGAADPDDDSFGLEGIRRRVERLDGEVEITSASGEGTRIAVHLPLRVPFRDGA